MAHTIKVYKLLRLNKTTRVLEQTIFILNVKIKSKSLRVIKYEWPLS